VKVENAQHRNSLLAMYAQLQLQNKAIEDQQQVILEKASILQKQTAKLKESNKVKSKLFSIISHDLRDPMFALRNFFQQASKKGLSTEQLNELMPDIIHDLNHSSVLLENLLEWAKGQMRADTVKWQTLDIDNMMEEVSEMLQLQLKAKNIQLIKNCGSAEFAQGDRAMILLVMRNLVSNAIKFTSEGGQIILGSSHSIKGIKIYVKDNGRGISKEQLKKINKNIFYTTCGTKNETGSGLGLMLSKEFLFRNESQLLVESEPGEGSTFSFMLKPVDLKIQDGLSRSGYSDSQDPRALLV
jgi:signal transduction histidine kinase